MLHLVLDLNIVLMLLLVLNLILVWYTIFGQWLLERLLCLQGRLPRCELLLLLRPFLLAARPRLLRSSGLRLASAWWRSMGLRIWRSRLM